MILVNNIGPCITILLFYFNIEVYQLILKVSPIDRFTLIIIRYIFIKGISIEP
jgi:hypothetical protein